MDSLGLQGALASIIPDIRKGVVTSNNPEQEGSRLAQTEANTNGKKTGPFGEVTYGGNGIGVLSKLSQYPKLQSNNPLSALNMRPFSLDPILHNTEQDANRKLVYSRCVAPMASGIPMKLKKTQIVFTHRTSTGANPVRRCYPFADTNSLGYGTPPTYSVDLVTLNWILLREQLKLYLEQDKNNKYQELDPLFFLKDWRIDGIVEKDSVPASSMNLYQRVNLVKAGQIECQNFWGGDYQTGDELYLIFKKYDWVTNTELDKIHETCPGLGFPRYAEKIRFRPYQFGPYVTSSGQVELKAREYYDEMSEITRYDGLPIYMGRVWAEPRFHSLRNGSYGKHIDGRSVLGHALRNPEEGISSETVTNLVILLNSNGGERPV